MGPDDSDACPGRGRVGPVIDDSPRGKLMTALLLE
jgi:hypothetical protein